MIKQNSKKSIKKRWTLIALLGAFSSPVLLASWLLSSSSYIAYLGSIAEGRWMSSQVSVKNDSAKWIILGMDDQLTNAQKIRLNKLHLLLGKSRDHVELRWVSSGDLIKKLSFSSIDPVFLADPQGKVLMSYHHDQIGKPLLADIKHLIRHNPK